MFAASAMKHNIAMYVNCIQKSIYSQFKQNSTKSMSWMAAKTLEREQQLQSGISMEMNEKISMTLSIHC